MKKSVKGIIGLCAALAVLGGGLAALKLTEPEEKEESSVSVEDVEGAGIVLIKDEEVSKATVTRAGDTLKVVQLTAKTESSAATYTLEGYEDIPLTTSVVGTLVNNAKGLQSSQLIAENCTELAKYGLEKPVITVELTYESGETAVLEIGDATPAASETYVKVKGEDDVYTVSTSKVANYSMELEGFISSTILEEPAEEEYPIVNSVRIQRDDIDYDIYIEYDIKSEDDDYTSGTSATHILIEPIFSYLNVDQSAAITNGMFGLSSDGIFSIHADEADIAEAGLNDPFCTVTMSCDDGNDYVFLMSEPFSDENGETAHYGMLENGNMIYIVSAEDAKWGTVMPVDIASKIMFGTYVWNITELTASGSGAVTSEFVITHKADAEDANNSAHFDTTRNGQTFDTERYRQFYQFLVSAPAEDFAIGEEIPASEPIAVIEHNDYYTQQVNKIEFYEYSALKSLVVVNGEARFFCSKSYAETVLENIKRIESGEDYITTWK